VNKAIKTETKAQL